MDGRSRRLTAPSPAGQCRSEANNRSHRPFRTPPVRVRRLSGKQKCHGIEGGFMGSEARIGLLLGAAACLMAVLVDWVVEELAD
jgi:hypothetical protein